MFAVVKAAPVCRAPENLFLFVEPIHIKMITSAAFCGENGSSDLLFHLTMEKRTVISTIKSPKCSCAHFLSPKYHSVCLLVMHLNAFSVTFPHPTPQEVLTNTFHFSLK